MQAATAAEGAEDLLERDVERDRRELERAERGRRAAELPVDETGERAGDYVSLRIDDPALAQPIRAALFQNTGDKSAWSLRWNRKPKSREQD